jgi:hypothetical protein
MDHRQFYIHTWFYLYLWVQFNKYVTITFTWTVFSPREYTAASSQYLSTDTVYYIIFLLMKLQLQNNVNIIKTNKTQGIENKAHSHSMKINP